MSKHIYLILEGDDDVRFFKAIIEPLFNEKGVTVDYVMQYRKKRIKIAKFIKSIRSMTDKDYIYVKDINSHPCVSSRKEHVLEDLSGLIDYNKIFIVIKEIESWYLAGADAKTLKSLRVNRKNIDRISKSTDDVDKEQFYKLFQQDLPQIQIMEELLNNYNISIAIGRNRSFHHFVDFLSHRLEIR